MADTPKKLPRSAKSPTPAEIPLSPLEQDRVQTWKERRTKDNPGFSYKLGKKKGNTTQIKTDFSARSNLSPRQKAEIQRSLQCAISGSANDAYSSLFIEESIAALNAGSVKSEDLLANALSAGLLAMAPKDIIESQLCARLLVLQSQALRFINRAGNAIDSRIIDTNINRSTKLMRLYNETLEALNRYRRKGEQKVTVQHVNVNNGGQAVVAGEFTGGGGNEEKIKE